MLTLSWGERDEDRAAELVGSYDFNQASGLDGAISTSPSGAERGNVEASHISHARTSSEPSSGSSQHLSLPGNSEVIKAEIYLETTELTVSAPTTTKVGISVETLGTKAASSLWLGVVYGAAALMVGTVLMAFWKKSNSSKRRRQGYSKIPATHERMV
ncbi:unnamed protein product [Heterosigma akashiwo]